jgi:hypothetical protein
MSKGVQDCSGGLVSGRSRPSRLPIIDSLVMTVEEGVVGPDSPIPVRSTIDEQVQIPVSFQRLRNVVTAKLVLVLI